nr:putative protein phosphatase 2c 53 [Quercus suber]
MLSGSGGVHSSHRFGVQFLRSRSDRQERFPLSKSFSLILTKNRKIRSLWLRLCGLFGIPDFQQANSTVSLQSRSTIQSRVNDQEAVDVVLREKNLLMSCKKLVDMSSSRGSMDDITVMVIDLLNFVATGC